MTILQNLNKVDLGMEDCSLEIIGKEEVAAATDVEHRTGKFLKLYVNKICH